MSEEIRIFKKNELETIARCLGDTINGLPGSKIQLILDQAGISNVAPSNSKWVIIYKAFEDEQQKMKNRIKIIDFIRIAMCPSSYIGNKEKYENLRTELNKALLFCGLEVRDNGELYSCNKVSTLSEAEKRAKNLRASLELRDIHKDVLKFCKVELLQDNYFHAVFEAVKSIMDKLRKLSGSLEDGHKLVDECFCIRSPILKINNLSTRSEESEQNGFIYLIKGIYSMFRNPIAHEAKIFWKGTQQDAEDLLTLVSMIHRRIDNLK